MARARVLAGPLLRVLGLAAVLFAVVLTHGAAPENHVGHGVTGTAAHGTATPEHALPGAVADLVDPAAVLFVGPRHGHGEHGPGGPAEHCAPAQPQQGPALAQPRFAASVREAATPDRAPTPRRADEPLPADASSAALRTLVVQQV
ncbi:hypothetical protein [Streptomyces griseiscabiei]|uniref:Secreted protein n=1 Tax=Streptomyces griseiscabiei TaxID=2993540 RepID=A0ABU4L302_9ACTN|nr:hypothetical protein [Streptomyces griseiscabiei]MBZ3901358.1 hypothetical protein [Streptomyces griseiscabiei]MDX2910091.1 hypothetical protein [Streptomyces griseiscabiei]